MLTAYVDESGIDQGGWMFVAGFLGSEDAWTMADSKWKEAIAPREHLHMKQLRLNERHRTLLAKAGAVPDLCGLTPILGGVRYGDYEDLIIGRKDSKLMAGYVGCCFPMIVCTLRGMPANEQLRVIYEEQPVHGPNLSTALRAMQTVSSAEMCLADGTTKLAAWQPVPKGLTSRTEIADCFSYALFQLWKDKNSLRTNLCRTNSQILRRSRIWSHHASADDSSSNLTGSSL